MQASAEFAQSEAIYGWGLAAFFLGATAGSVVFGRLAQRVGPRTQVAGALIVSGATSVFIAASAQSFLLFVAALSVAGLANSANQSAINLLLSQAQLPRLGLAIALKQSGMPGASLLGGLAVPLIAVTVGWRWAYVVAAVMTMLALLAVWRFTESIDRPEQTVSQLGTDRNRLFVASTGFACTAFAAGALNAWTVSSGVESGLTPGQAGLLLSLGASFGIAVRLLIGVRLDSMSVNPLTAAARLTAIGALGVGFLSLQRVSPVIGATVVAFGCGWVWPVFTNFAVVNANRDAAAAATGITQTGVYIGVFSGPLLSGVLIETFGYSTMWLVTSAVMAVGAFITGSLARHF